MKFYKFIHSAFVFLVPALAATVVPQFALAQSQFQIEEIVVSARKREESLQEVPVAITVFTGDGLDQAGITSTRDLFANTPGLNYDTGFDQNAGTPAIRGVVSNEIATYRQKVTTFLDGMPILGQQGSVPFTAIDQVEVLRGPQSAAFGRSTFGGAINYTTVDPGDSLEFEFNMDIGSDSMKNTGMLISGPIFEGVLSGLIAYASNEQDGEKEWVTVDEGKALGGESSDNYLVKLLHTPTDSLAIELRYKKLEVDNQQTPRAFFDVDDAHRVIHPDAAATVTTCGTGVPIPSCAFVGDVDAFTQVYDYNYSAIGIDDPFVRDDRERYEGEITYDFSNGGTLQILGFNSEEYYERATDADLANNAAGFERDPTDIEESYAEIRYASAGDQPFRYSGGVSLYDYDFLTTVYRSETAYLAGPSAGRRISESASNTGLFFNLTYDINDQWTASLEGRSQDDDVSGNAISSTGGLTELSQSTSAFLPRGALTYSPSDDMTVYFQVAKGNNPAGVNAGALNDQIIDAFAAFPGAFPTDLQNIAFFEEEEVLSYEVGVKGVFNERMTYALNAYALDWKNYTQAFNLNFEPTDFVDIDDDNIGDVGTIYDGLRFGPGRSFLGAGDVTGTGLEFEGSYIATDNLRIGLAASYIDITYDEGACSTIPLDYGVPANATTSIGLPCVDISGNELGTQPKLSGAVSLDYNYPLDGGKELFARWSTRFQSSQYVSEMNLAELGAYSISDFRTGISTDNWSCLHDGVLVSKAASMYPR